MLALYYHSISQCNLQKLIFDTEINVPLATCVPAGVKKLWFGVTKNIFYTSSLAREK